MIVRLAVSLWLSLVVLGVSAPALAQSPSTADEQALAEAKRHFEAGKNAYTAGDYQTAIREFKAAEALRPSPMLAYNIGLANEKLGKRRVAVKYYRRYLEGAPGAPNRAEVEQRITTLEHDIAANPNAPANNQPQQVERPSDMPPEQPPPGYTGTQQPGYDPYQAQPGQQPVQPVAAKKKQNLWWVWMLVGIGSAALLAGIIAAAVIVTRASNDVYYGYVQQGGMVGAGVGAAPAYMPAQSGPAASHRAPDTVNLTIRF